MPGHNATTFAPTPSDGDTFPTFTTLANPKRFNQAFAATALTVHTPSGLAPAFPIPSDGAAQITTTTTPMTRTITEEELERNNTITVSPNQVAVIGSDVNVELGMGSGNQSIRVQSGASLTIQSGAVVNLGDGKDEIRIFSNGTLTIQSGATVNLGHGDDEIRILSNGTLTIQSGAVVNLGDGKDEIRIFSNGILTMESGGVVNLGHDDDAISISSNGTLAIKSGARVNLGAGKDEIRIFSNGTLTIESGAVVNLGHGDDEFSNAGSVIVGGELLFGSGTDQFDNNNPAKSDLTIEGGGLLDFGTGTDETFSSVGKLTVGVGGTETPKTAVLNLPTASKVTLRNLDMVIDYAEAWRPMEGETFALFRAGDTGLMSYENIDISDTGGSGSYSWESVVESDINTLVVTVGEIRRPAFGMWTIERQTFVTDEPLTIALPEVEIAGGGDLTYTLTPPLPAGLEFSETARTIRGIPAEPFPTTEFMYAAIDTFGFSASLTFAMGVAAPLTFEGPGITDQIYTAGVTITPFTLTAASGGSGSYNYEVLNLPAGLTFATTTMKREISGTPVAATVATVTYRALDAAVDASVLKPAEQTFTVAVYNPVMLEDIDIPDVGFIFTANEPITPFTLTEATGGSGSYNYEVLNLPASLEFSQTARTISGIPDAATVATVTYRAIDKVGNGAVLEPAVETFAIEVIPNPTHFVTTWRTISDNERITIPTFTGTETEDEIYDYTVYWGDGAVTRNHTGDADHTYASAGDYEVRISGTFPRIYFNDEGDKEKIIAVNQWGEDRAWTSMENAFYGAVHLAGQATDTPDLSGVTNMAFMFRGARAFNQDIGNWDVDNVTNMNQMFLNARAFNQNIGNWDVGNVTNMRFMFSLATAFNQNIGDWNVGNVTDMASMFQNARDFNGPIGDWDVSNVTDMNFMFSAASDFNRPIGDWDVGNVTDMTSMFQQANAFNQNIGDWDVSNVTDMESMFFLATPFNQDVGDWDVSNVTDMNFMFAGADLFQRQLRCTIDWLVYHRCR